MSLLRKVEALATFFAGMLLGVSCTLNNNTTTAQDKLRKENDPDLELVSVSSPEGWELWRHRKWTPPLSREVRYYLTRSVVQRKIALGEEFKRDHLYEQLGEKGKPKLLQEKIWSFTQALHAVAKAYLLCPPHPDRFPELRKELQGRPRLADDAFDYHLDGVFEAPTDVAGFARQNDRIYVIWVEAVFARKNLNNQFWVNARTGEVAALFPPRQWSHLRRDVRILLE